jgi:hypothetical protein
VISDAGAALRRQMDLERHLTVLLAHRRIILGGVVLGLITAFLAAYQPTTSGFERRGSEEWSSNSLILVTQKGFPWGRVTLPVAPLPGEATSPETATVLEEAIREESDRVPYADPTRFSALALLYSVMSYSDRVRENLPGRPVPGQVTALPFDPTGQGDDLLPILQITTNSDSASAARELNRQTVAGLRRTILDEQRSSSIPENERVQLQVLSEPAGATLVAGRSWVSSILALMLCIGGAIALAHLREGMSIGRGRKAEFEGLAAEEFNVEPDLSLWNGTSSPWDGARADETRPLTPQFQKARNRPGDG